MTPVPNFVERRPGNAFLIAKLLMLPDLTRWERSFLSAIAKRRTLSPREQRILDALDVKYLKGKTR
jgi:hypothetical protein